MPPKFRGGQFGQRGGGVTGQQRGEPRGQGSGHSPGVGASGPASPGLFSLERTGGGEFRESEASDDSEGSDYEFRQGMEGFRQGAEVESRRGRGRQTLRVGEKRDKKIQFDVYEDERQKFVALKQESGIGSNADFLMYLLNLYQREQVEPIGAASTPVKATKRLRESTTPRKQGESSGAMASSFDPLEDIEAEMESEGARKQSGFIMA